MGITLLTMIFLVARSIQSRKFYMLALKYCLYIIFVIGIVVLMSILGNATVESVFLQNEHLRPVE